MISKQKKNFGVKGELSPNYYKLDDPRGCGENLSQSEIYRRATFGNSGWKPLIITLCIIFVKCRFWKYNIFRCYGGLIRDIKRMLTFIANNRFCNKFVCIVYYKCIQYVMGVTLLYFAWKPPVTFRAFFLLFVIRYWRNISVEKNSNRFNCCFFFRFSYNYVMENYPTKITENPTIPHWNPNLIIAKLPKTSQYLCPDFHYYWDIEFFGCYSYL